MSAQTKKATDPFVITRTFDAPREVVYATWTDPEHLKQWCAPTGFTIAYKRCEIRVGGTAHYSMSGPGGLTMWGKVIYKVIDKPKKLVYLQSFSDENEGIGVHPMAPTWPREMLTEIVFEEQGKKTLITLTWTPINPSAEEIAAFDGGREGMKGGWGGTFDQLDSYLAQSTK